MVALILGNMIVLDTYRDEVNNFNDDVFDTNKHKLSSEQINDFFGFETNKLKIEDLYKLFNYLCQGSVEIGKKSS